MFNYNEISRVATWWEDNIKLFVARRWTHNEILDLDDDSNWEYLPANWWFV